jgi:hypothetical protein
LGSCQHEGEEDIDDSDQKEDCQNEKRCQQTRIASRNLLITEEIHGLVSLRKN